MSYHDVYCAICGSTFRSSLSIDSDETHLTYSGDVIGESDLHWLDTLCALGYNADIPGERKSFITGPGSWCSPTTASGKYLEPEINVTRGNDPNVPLDGNDEVSALIPYVLDSFVYLWSFARPQDFHEEDDILTVFPFHQVCYNDILFRCFKDEKINEDVLYALFKEMRQNQDRGLALDYGQPTPPREALWQCNKGEEVLVTHPVNIPPLDVYLESIPQLLVGVEKESSECPAVQGGHDIFDKLPFELCQIIFDLLPISSILAIKAASFSMHARPYALWKQKLEADIPWLWEVHDIDPFKSQAMKAKFSQMFGELEKKSRYNK